MKCFIIDLGTPKEVLFFKPIYEELKSRGNNVVLTTRNNPESLALIKHYGMSVLRIGKFGDTKYNKLLFGIKRMEQLLPLFETFRPDGLITLAEPNIIRLAFGLGVPIYNFIDIPEAEAVCRLTVPLAKWNFIPFVVPRHEMMKYGAKQLYIYQCLDPIAWLPKDSGKLDKKFQDKHPFIVWRRGETIASYYKDKEFIDITPKIIEELKRKYPTYYFYEIPRYRKHEIVNLSSLLNNADLFVGGGGTIQIESAYWGTWTITTRPFKTYYDDFLVNDGLMDRALTVEHGVAIAENVLTRIPSKNENSRMLRNMVFPIKEICDRIESGQ